MTSYASVPDNVMGTKTVWLYTEYKYQSLTHPSQLDSISLLKTMFAERRHDAALLVESGLLNSLQQHALSHTDQLLCIYGDPAYPLWVHLQAPYRAAVLTPQMQQLNKSMSAVHESVEWLFGDIINFVSKKIVDFKKNLNSCEPVSTFHKRPFCLDHFELYIFKCVGGKQHVLSTTLERLMSTLWAMSLG